MDDLYQILGVEKTATSVEIKKAYRKLALLYHPDKVKEDERDDAEVKFKEVSAAYEILMDDAKREEYDAYGTFDGYRNGGSYGQNFNGNPFGDAGYDGEFGPDDFFNFFNGMNGGVPRAHTSAKPQKPRTEDAKLEVEVTLEDLFKGKVIKTTSTRNIICVTCKGTGAKPKAIPKKCAICDGAGVVRKIRRVGPGMVTQDYLECTDCKGTGKLFRTKDKCKKCEGTCLREETKILEFEIVKGSKSGESVVLKNESDEAPGKATGDVILTFTAKPHNVFTRKGDDLYATLDIPLVDALCGFSRTILTHLDGRGIKVKTPNGKVIRPNDYLRIPNEGMPIKGTNKFGDLYIKTNIIFPKDNWFVEKNDQDKLKNLIPGDTTKQANGNLSESDISLVDFTIIKQPSLPDYPEEKKETEDHEEEYYHDYYETHEPAEPQCAQQ